MTLGRAVANRILKLCEERDITINGLSIICGMTQSTLNNIVNKGSEDPKISTIKKICDGLEMRMCTFFDSPDFDMLDQEIK